jgi:hypothetical protein
MRAERHILTKEIKMIKQTRLPVSGFPRTVMALLVIILTFPMLCAAEEPSSDRAPYQEVGWSTFIRGGYVHQFDTDIDDGGSFSVNRLVVQGGVTYGFDARRSVSLALGYGYDGYDFSGTRGFGALDPWGNIHSFRASLPVRYGIDEAWTVFVVPTVRVTKESGADTGDAVSGGGFAGFSYRFSDRLTIGPGIGVISQIEDSASIFPVLIIDWKITDTLSLSTGRGVGATLGPGLALNWEPHNKWTLSFGGRYERLRFRLDNDQIAPKGIGDDRAIPVFGGVTYSFNRKAQVALLAGVELGGELRLEDEQGNLITESDHDPAGFLGFTFSFKF